MVTRKKWCNIHCSFDPDCMDCNIDATHPAVLPPQLGEPTKEEPVPARKDDTGKPDMSLITYDMVAPAANILKFGEKKYGRLNFRNPSPGFEQRLIAATLRHMLAHTGGEELDPESGEPHLAHALASLMLIFDRRKNEVKV